MLGQVVYYDGTTEPILSYDERIGYCEVTTLSGKYLYDSFITELDNGMKYKSHAFYYYDKSCYSWLLNQNIKMFQINNDN